MNIGDLNIANLCVGSQQVLSACLGTDVVWPASGAPGPVPYEQQYLTFEFVEIPEGGTGGIVWQTAYGETDTNREPKTIQMRVNGGSWVSLDNTTRVVECGFTIGDKIEFRGYNANYGGTRGDANTCNNLLPTPDSAVKVYGNIMSLIDGDNFSGLTAFTSANTNAFSNLFRRLNYTNPTYYVITGGYLVDVENLILPATVLPQGESLYEGNYYRYLFAGQARFTKAPVLPAATLPTGGSSAYGCYNKMFSGCTSLNYIVCLATSIGAFSTYNWVSGVASTGTFVKNANMTSWTTGNDGIPTGWTVVDV